MEINVAQLLKSPIGSEREYNIDETVDAGSDVGYQVQGRVNLTRTDCSILVKGTLATSTELTCSRCLSPFQYPLDFSIEEEYHPTIDIITGAALAPLEDTERFTINERHVLDLNEAVRQHMLLVLPMKPLCTANCAGLCPDCGHNLNLGPCACPPRHRDPRWAKLATLDLTDQEKGN